MTSGLARDAPVAAYRRDRRAVRFWRMVERFLHRADKAHVDKIGRCIYCTDVVTENLTKEHVNPHGMGGGVVLLDASCKKHKDIIDPFEGHVVNKQFGPVRHMHGMPSRNERPTHYPGAVKRNGFIRKEDVPLEFYPDILTLPTFANAPTILKGGEPCRVAIAEVRAYHSAEENAAKLKQFGAEEILVVPDFLPDFFVRWLAKVAHGIAVANYGMEFEPLLLGVIEGKLDGAGYVIGAQVKDIPAPSTANQHTIGTSVMYQNENDGLIVTHIQLFAESNTPVYSLVVGRPSAALNERLVAEPAESS